MQIVVPMAGLGRRFSEAGYRLPKPLIPIDGRPMVVRAVQDLPTAQRYVFVCHPDHAIAFPLAATLSEYFPDCHVVLTPGLTDGQACTVRLAGSALHADQPVLVTACDNTHLYSGSRFAKLTGSGGPDCLIWTYRRDPRVLINPRWYGWVQADEGGNVNRVSVKVPISDQPMQNHAITGCFWFRSAKLLNAAIDSLVTRNIRVNGEFYLDSVPGVLLEWGCAVEVFEVDKYIGWGTPDDLEEYQRWRQYFVQSAAA